VPHIGHRDNPITVAEMGDLDRAVKRVWDPTPGQAEAGNYQKAHAIIGGLDVTIETPLGRTRSGIGPDGTPWSVTMPAHYGYVKRTVGADGDHVDVYIGHEAHRAHELPVYVVDQCDAETLKFDEHKAMLGFEDSTAARCTYLTAFSDGKARRRVGAVTRMTFPEFVRWLDKGETKRPVAYARSMAFPASACACVRCQTAAERVSGGPGGPMSDDTRTDATKAAGVFSRLMAKAWPAMTKAERDDMLKDAAVTAGVELGKATDLLHEGDDHERIGRVEDLFDGPPDDRLETVRAGGPEGSVAPGKVGIGPSQDASGAGADRMERTYSRHAPQTGVQRATEELGAKLRSHGAALKSLIAFGQTMTRRMGMIEKSLETVGSPTIDQAAIDAAIKAAVAKALPEAVSVVLAKAVPVLVKAITKAKDDEKEDEKDDEKESGKDDEEEDEDEEADQEESGSGTDIEIVNELEDEGEDEADEAKKAVLKAAARERRIAKALIRLAKADERETREAMEEGRHKAGQRHHKRGMKRMAKAQLHAAIAKSLRDGKAGPSMAAIEKSLGAVAKALHEAKAKNQDKWPASEAKRVGKADTTGASQPDVVKAMAEMADTLAKANAGYALLQADVQKVMQMVGGQSRDSGGGPPVEALFKGDVLPFQTKEAKITALAMERSITPAERDKAMDALATMRQPGLPQGMIEATINALPVPVQTILRAA